jgi:hypothetical protein
MAHHQPVSIDPQELQRAQAIWHNFTNLIKWSAVAIAITLILMALAFIG